MTLNVLIITKKDGAGKTRLIPQTVKSHLDYLRISASLDPCRFNELLLYCDNENIGVLPDKRWSAGAGAPYYDNKIVSPNGIIGGYTNNLETEKIDLMIDFSGQYFEGITVENTWRFLMGLKHSYKVKCNRIDLAIDDSTYEIIPVDNMYQSWVDGNNFGFRKCKKVGEGKSLEDWKETIYFGSRNSGKMVRIYDHDSECLRFEVEYKRHYSQLIFDFIADIERSWFERVLYEDESIDSCMDAIKNISNRLGLKDVFASEENIVKELHGCNNKFDIILQRMLCSLAVTAIDFRDKTVRKDRQKASLKDTKRLDFYQEFIDKVGAEIKIKSSTNKRTLRKTIAWMQRQVSKIYSVIRDGVGAENFISWQSEFIDLGRKRQSNYDLKVVQLIRNNPQLVRLDTVSN